MAHGQHRNSISLEEPKPSEPLESGSAGGKSLSAGWSKLAVRYNDL